MAGQSEKILEEALKGNFDINRFRQLCREIFKSGSLKTVPVKVSKPLGKPWGEYIKALWEIGSYEDLKGRRLAILALEVSQSGVPGLKREVERNFAAKYMKEKGFHGAFGAFYSREGRWRLSFIRPDTTAADGGQSNGFIPARRYSFFAGEGEPIHAAKSQLLPLLRRGRKGITLDEIEGAFSGEKVKKTFFVHYRDKYLELKRFLEEDREFARNSEDQSLRGESLSARISKELMNRLFILHLLKKEGVSYFKADIPESIYSKVEGEAEKVLDMFGRYNFTMREPEPFEEEAAVGPEMMGKIFESLLDEGDRKSKGTFYTPSEIVHYMCREALANYLSGQVDMPFEDIREFLLWGDIEGDAGSMDGAKVGGFAVKRSIYDRLMDIDEAISRVKIADISVGSGEFLLGMLFQIVRLRCSITRYMVEKKINGPGRRENLEQYIRTQRSPYRLKLETIKNSLFAMDVDECAAGITKLRLWLSAAADCDASHGEPDIPGPQELHMNIYTGNSLVGECRALNDFMKGCAFDIVIGNPPYVDYRKIDSSTKKGLKGYETYKSRKNGSLYLYFIEKGYRLLNEKGTLVFINPCQYLTADSGLGIRKFLIPKRAIKKIVDLSNINVFKAASTYTCINVISKREDAEYIQVFKPKNIKELEVRGRDVDYRHIREEEGYAVILSPDSVVARVDMVKTKLGDFADIFCGTSKTGFREYVISREEYLKEKSSSYAPLLESKAIGKFKYDLKSYVHRSIYPKYIQDIFNHNENLFLARMTKRVRVCRAEKGFFGGKVNCITNMKLSRDYIAAVLNSSLIDYYYKMKNESKHLRGGYLGFDIPSVESIPLPEAGLEVQKRISNLVDDIYANINHEDHVKEVKNLIDRLVYKLYNLTPRDIEMVERFKLTCEK